MTSLMLAGLVVLIGLVAAILRYGAAVDVGGDAPVICAIVFFVGLIPAVEIDKRFPWCPKCRGPWTGRSVGRASGSTRVTPEESMYDASAGAFERKETIVVSGGKSYVCKRCRHRFVQRWRIRHRS